MSLCVIHLRPVQGELCFSAISWDSHSVCITTDVFSRFFLSEAEQHHSSLTHSSLTTVPSPQFPHHSSLTTVPSPQFPQRARDTQEEGWILKPAAFTSDVCKAAVSLQCKSLLVSTWIHGSELLLVPGPFTNEFKPIRTIHQLNVKHDRRHHRWSRLVSGGGGMPGDRWLFSGFCSEPVRQLETSRRRRRL